MKHDNCGGRWMEVWNNFRDGRPITKRVYECSKCHQPGYNA